MWHPAEKRVYWVDIPAARLHRYDPRSGAHETFDTGTPAGGFTIQPDGALLLFMARGAVRLWSGGGFAGTVVEEIPDERDSRFNDVIADPEGRVFAGTMSTAQRAGRLYRLDRDGSVRAVLEGIGTPNGMGFTPDLGRWRSACSTTTGKRAGSPTGACSRAARAASAAGPTA
jgi:D-xylonolactonase